MVEKVRVFVRWPESSDLFADFCLALFSLRDEGRVKVFVSDPENQMFGLEIKGCVRVGEYVFVPLPKSSLFVPAPEEEVLILRKAGKNVYEFYGLSGLDNVLEIAREVLDDLFDRIYSQVSPPPVE